VMSPGSAFHNLHVAAITGKARSPSVECRVTGTDDDDDDVRIDFNVA